MNVPSNVPALVALVGIGLHLIVMAVLSRFAATHYTRQPGTGWATWEKAA